MSDQQLPETQYDVIIAGTGLTESIIAGALCRSGRRVLHMDAEPHYGSREATLTLREWRSRAPSLSSSDTATVSSAGHGTAIAFRPPSFRRECPGKAGELAQEEQQEREQTLPAGLSERDGRQLCIDPYATKLVYSNGPLVQLLVQSGVARYLEFRCVDALLLYMEGGFRRVPSSKSEIFKDRFLSLAEKRFLMKFTQYCLAFVKTRKEGGQTADPLYEEYKDRPFVEFLDRHRMTPRLQQFVIFAIALYDGDITPHADDGEEIHAATTKDAMQRMEMYMDSLGRYGNTAFLYPMYGTAELSQAFCRLSAVYGGTYVLRRSPQELIIRRPGSGHGQDGKADEEVEEEENAKAGCQNSKKTKASAIRCTAGQELEFKHLVMNRDYVLHANGHEDASSATNCLYRTVIITDAYVFNPAEHRDVNDLKQQQQQQQIGGSIVALIPPRALCEEQACTIYISQMDNSGAVAPKGKYIIYVQMRGEANAKEENFAMLQRAVGKYVISALPQETDNQQKKDAEKDENISTNKHILYCDTHAHPIRIGQVGQHTSTAIDSKLENVHYVDDAGSDLSLEDCVKRAKDIFHTVMGNDTEEFLPKMAEPEDSSEMYDQESRLLGVPQDMINGSSESQRAEKEESQQPQQEQSVAEEAQEDTATSD